MAHISRREFFSFEHKNLGPMKGLLFPSSDPAWNFYGSKDSPALSLSLSDNSKGIVQFRGIPYASIPARFRQSQMLTSVPKSFDSRPPRDFTEFGYGCPQLDQAKEPRGGPLGPESVRRYDEWSCLNLNVTCPVEALEQVKNGGPGPSLPVMVYVHGGGFSEGAGHISLTHDMSRIVALSAAEGRPVIGVAIGYRVNWHGFLACQDLIDEAWESGCNEPMFNFGLHDQRNAFLWLKQFVAGFGGDNENITAFGESAGGASLSLHCTADVPLFRRVIIQSGAPHTLPVQSKEFHEEQYRKLLEHLNIREHSVEGRLRALRAVPSERLVDAVRDLRQPLFYPYRRPEAGMWSSPGKTLTTTEAELINQTLWLEDIVIGDCTYEGYVIMGMMKQPDHQKLVQQFVGVLGEANAEKVLSYYDIEAHSSMDANLFWTNCLVLLGDIFFSQRIDEIAKGLLSSNDKRRNVYRYTIGMSNPFVGSANSYVPGHHFIELLYIFMTLRERMPKHRNNFFARQGEELARKWIQFANGMKPWPHYDEEGSLLVCDDRAGCSVRTRAEDEAVSQEDVWGPRRYQGWDILSEAITDAARSKAKCGQSQAEAVEELRRLLLDFSAYEGEPF